MGLINNIKSGKITTALGLAVFLSGIGLFLAKYVIELKEDPNVWICIGMMVGGIILIVSPDTFVRAVNKGIDKYSKDGSKEKEIDPSEGKE